MLDTEKQLLLGDLPRMSADPRVCMGMGFAMIESQILLGTRRSRFRDRLVSPGNIPPRSIVTLPLAQPVMLKLERIVPPSLPGLP